MNYVLILWGVFLISVAIGYAIFTIFSA